MKTINEPSDEITDGFVFDPSTGSYFPEKEIKENYSEIAKNPKNEKEVLGLNISEHKNPP